MAELADELGIYKQTAFKIAKRLGIEPVKRQDPARGNQTTSFVTETDATAMRETLAQSRRGGIRVNSELVEFTPDEGWFYLIQLEPEHDPGRFKVGFTTDLDGRLRHHRCSAPYVAYLKTWPCKRLWERTTIDCLTSGTEQLHTEVFRTASLEQVMEKGDRFFSIMPPVVPTASPESDDDERLALGENRLTNGCA
ncbi:MAG: GIY-YIG nuclease family protein [Planctomycetaceae bacterium]